MNALQALPFVIACIVFGACARSLAGDFHTLECILWQHCVWSTFFVIWWFIKLGIAVVALLAIVLLPPALT